VEHPGNYHYIIFHSEKLITFDFFYIHKPSRKLYVCDGDTILSYLLCGGQQKGQFSGKRVDLKSPISFHPSELIYDFYLSNYHWINIFFLKPPVTINLVVLIKPRKMKAIPWKKFSLEIILKKQKTYIKFLLTFTFNMVDWKFK